MKKRTIAAFVVLGSVAACSSLAYLGERNKELHQQAPASSPDMTMASQSTSQPATQSAAQPTVVNTPDNLSVATADDQAQDTTITLVKYSRLRSGMTYGQVVTILGRPGNELSSTDLAGIHTAMYAWQNDDGTNMNAMFQRNRLVSKSQFGLK